MATGSWSMAQVTNQLKRNYEEAVRRHGGDVAPTRILPAISMPTSEHDGGDDNNRDPKSTKPPNGMIGNGVHSDTTLSETGDDDDECLESNDECDDDSDIEGEDEDLNSSEEEEETRMAHALVQAAFSQRATVKPNHWTTPLLRHSMVEQQHHQCGTRNKRLRYSIIGAMPSTAATTITALPPPLLPHQSSPVASPSKIRLSQSEPFISSPGVPKKTTKNAAVPAASSSHTNAVFPLHTKPDDCLRDLFRRQQQDSVQYFSAMSLQGFFAELTKESLDSYDMALAKAVHLEDVATLRTIFQSGKSLHTGNKFGETVIHAVCRRGSLVVLKFLLQEVHVPLSVCCDSFRTPLHDACWTARRPGPVIDLILDHCPDLLFITDKRGFTPLQYVPKERWEDWCQYLCNRGVERLRPRTLLLR